MHAYANHPLHPSSPLHLLHLYPLQPYFYSTPYTGTKKAITYKTKGDKNAAMQMLNRRKMLTSSRDSTWGSMQKIQEMQFALEQAHNHAETLSIIDEGTRTIQKTRTKFGLDEDKVYDINERLRDELDGVNKVGEMLACDATEDDPDLLDELAELGELEEEAPTAAPVVAAAPSAAALPSAPLPSAPVGAPTAADAVGTSEEEAEFAALAASMNM